MHRFTLAIAVTAALLISAPAYAQKGHGGGKPPTNTHGNSAATTHGNNAATTHANSGTTAHPQSGSHATNTTTSGNAHASNVTHGKSGDTHGNSPKATNVTASGSNTTGGSNTPSGSNTTPNTPLTPVQQKLQKNTNLADKLRTRLPEGTDLMKASTGFKNLGQFVAAVNVSNNHEGVTFKQLKTRMVDQGMSLGQALQDVKKLPNANVQTEVHRAETEANEMIKSTTTSNTTATTNTKSTPNTTSSTSNTPANTTAKKTAKTRTGSTDNK